MQIKCLAQGKNIQLPGFEPSTSVSKTDILANRPICSVLTNNADIVNEFNRFFTNIGKEITNNIPSISSKTINNYLRDKDDHSMFLEPTGEEEIHNVVSQFSSRRSRDHHDINMYCIKYIISSITKPLMHICNLSFST